MRGKRIAVVLCVGAGLAAMMSSLARASEDTAIADPETTAGGDADESLEIQHIELLDLEVPEVSLVTAGRREQKATQVPYAVGVVTAEDIRLAGARSIADALRLVPGVDVAELSYGNDAISPRGFHGYAANKTLVLVDGRQIYDALFGGTLWGNWPFQLEDVERIEVIRGPAGITWGANAVAGVINVITKDPNDQLGLTVTGEGGSRGSHKEHIGYGWADEKLRLRVSGEYEGSDGFERGNPAFGLAPLDDGYKAGRMGVHAIFEPGEADTLTFSAGSAVIGENVPPPALARLALQNAGGNSNYLSGDWKHRIAEDNELTLTAYVNDFYFDSGAATTEYRYQQLAFQLGHTFKPHEDHTITWGVDSRVDLFDASNGDPFMLSKDRVNTAVVGLYLQDEWRFAPQWIANLGARIDYDSYGGFQPSARAGVGYEVDDRSLIYGAVSRAYHMPTGASRFVSVPSGFGLLRATTDRDIDAISLVSYELGYRTTLWKRLDLEAAVYWNEYANLATTATKLGPPGLLNVHAENGADASTYGVELAATCRVTETLTLLGNYTYQAMDDRPYRRWGQDGDWIDPPKHKAMLGARYSVTDDLHVSGHAYFVDETRSANPDLAFLHKRIDEYVRLDLRAEHEFWNDRLSVAAGVKNLLDSHHDEGTSLSLDDAEVPRMVFAEARVVFR